MATRHSKGRNNLSSSALSAQALASSLPALRPFNYVTDHKLHFPCTTKTPGAVVNGVTWDFIESRETSVVDTTSYRSGTGSLLCTAVPTVGQTDHHLSILPQTGTWDLSAHKQAMVRFEVLTGTDGQPDSYKEIQYLSINFTDTGNRVRIYTVWRQYNSGGTDYLSPGWFEAAFSLNSMCTATAGPAGAFDWAHVQYIGLTMTTLDDTGAPQVRWDDFIVFGTKNTKAILCPYTDGNYADCLKAQAYLNALALPAGYTGNRPRLTVYLSVANIAPTSSVGLTVDQVLALQDMGAEFGIYAKHSDSTLWALPWGDLTDAQKIESIRHSQQFWLDAGVSPLNLRTMNIPGRGLTSPDDLYRKCPQLVDLIASDQREFYGTGQCMPLWDPRRCAHLTTPADSGVDAARGAGTLAAWVTQWTGEKSVFGHFSHLNPTGSSAQFVAWKADHDVLFAQVTAGNAEYATPSEIIEGRGITMA